MPETAECHKFKLNRNQRILFGYFLSGMVKSNDIARFITTYGYPITDKQVNNRFSTLGTKVKNEFIPEYDGKMTKLRILKILSINNQLDNIPIDNSNFPMLLKYNELTSREREILFLYSEGLSSRQISAVLENEEGTVNNMMEKIIHLRCESNSPDNNNFGISINQRDDEDESGNQSYTLAALAYRRVAPILCTAEGQSVPPLFTMPEEYQKYYYYEYLYPQILNR